MSRLLFSLRRMPDRGRVRSRVCLLGVWCGLLGVVPSLQAASAAVRFDAPLLVSCRDVTTDEFASANPHHRLVEARFEISALRGGTLDSDTLQYEYRFVNPTGTLQVVDYEPRTVQATPLAGNVNVEQTAESSKSLAANVSGGYQPFGQGTASADVNGKRVSHIRYELKPPLAVILVAGTIQRGTGVYFKLLPSAEASWEGSREFVIVMRVSSVWRGDVMYVHCEAQQNEQGRSVSRGVSRFSVGLHLAGDDAARVAAEHLHHTEVDLRRAVAQRRHDIQRRAVPTVVHRLGALLDVYDPRIPDTWLDRLIFGAPDIDEHAYVAYLPDDVRRAADRFLEAKRGLYEYSGKRAAPQYLGVAARATGTESRQ